MIPSQKLRDVARIVTNCGKGWLLKLTDECFKTRLLVIDVLCAKHPDIRVPDIDEGDQAQAFSDYLLCNDSVPIFC